MYLQGQTYKERVHNGVDSVTRIDYLGLVAHSEKSVFNPTWQLEFLGFILNSVSMTIRLTPEKVAGLKMACDAQLTNPSPTMWELARMVGKIVSSFPNVLKEAGVDITCFSGNSARSASTSRSVQSGLPLKDILKAGGWYQAGTFARYYNKPGQDNFGSHILAHFNNSST